MGVRTGRVVKKNLIAVDDDTLEVGTLVTILDSNDDEEEPALSPEDDEELLARSKSDDWVDAKDVMTELRNRSGGDSNR